LALPRRLRHKLYGDGRFYDVAPDPNEGREGKGDKVLEAPELVNWAFGFVFDPPFTGARILWIPARRLATSLPPGRGGVSSGMPQA